MAENKQVLVSLNPLGYAITLKDVDRILYPVTRIDTTESDNVAHFFRLSHDALTAPLVERYAMACEHMTNVSAASHHTDIRTKLIESLCGAKRCYCFAEYLACIEMCALHSDMLANFLCITNKEPLSEDGLINSLDSDVRSSVRKHLEKDDFYDHLNQKHRLCWLLAGSVLTQDDYDYLLKVHRIRIDYFHHWNTEYADIQDQSLICLKLISRVSSHYTEILDSDENLARIKAYLE